MNPKDKKSNTTKLSVSSIGDMTRQLLTLPINPEAKPEEHVRMSNDEIATQITKAFPQRKSSDGASACVAWYASKLRNDAKYRAKYGGKKPLPTLKELPARDVEIELPQS